MKTYIFDQNIGDGVKMTYHVKGVSKQDASSRLRKLLKSGKICEPNNQNTRVIKVERHDEEGTQLY